MGHTAVMGSKIVQRHVMMEIYRMGTGVAQVVKKKGYAHIQDQRYLVSYQTDVLCYK
jgi:hypothetical protein